MLLECLNITGTHFRICKFSQIGGSLSAHSSVSVSENKISKNKKNYISQNKGQNSLPLTKQITEKFLFLRASLKVDTTENKIHFESTPKQYCVEVKIVELQKSKSLLNFLQGQRLAYANDHQQCPPVDDT